MRPRRLLRTALAMATILLALPSLAPAIVLYQAGAGFRQPEFDLFRGDDLTPALEEATNFSYGGALCPTPGTPDFLCASVKGQAGISNGAVFLKALARMKRTNASAAHPETAAYAFARVTITQVGGYVFSGTAPGAVFYFGLHGTISESESDPNVPLQAFAVATLSTSLVGQSGVQCANTSCPPGTVVGVKVDHWDPSAGFQLDLRADVSIVTHTASGYDAEVVADFGDTVELLAIQLLDDQGQPIPNVSLYIPDQNGVPIVTLPSTPPDPAATATATVTPTPTPTPTPSATVLPTLNAGATKCRAAIIKAGAGFVQAKAKALQKCEEAKVKGKLPSSTVCLTEAKTAPVITKAIDKLTKSIVAACGGKDKLCGGADDESLAAIGWDITTCPNFENGTCTNTITSCSDIPTCLTCIGEAAVDQAVTLYYGSLAPTDPKSKDKAVKALNKCQVTIGKSAVTFLAAKSKALAKCWGSVNKAGSGSCPDSGTSAAIAKAESKKVAAICKACGGADKACGGADDLTPAAIGFPSTCPAVDPPGGAPSCFGAIASLQDVVTCVDCVTEFKVDCATLAAIPGFAAYPPECTASAIPSRQRYKKNIEYLGAADLQRLHDELLKFHLASYQYNTPGASPATHLGFIIDDVTPSPSVAANGDTVDLYGYTSMAVAAVQTQAHEIETLKREVESLRAQIATNARERCGACAAATRRSKRARTSGGNDPK